jgi:hypothetical protein
MELKSYFAIILNEHRDEFDKVLNHLSCESNVRSNRRITAIYPLTDITGYELDLSDDEALVMKLSVPGQFNLKDKAWMNFTTKYM